MCLFCVDTLLGQDQRICNSLEEKLQLYTELTDLTLQSPESVPHRHLLVQPVQYTDSETPRQASSLLTAALREGKKVLNFQHRIVMKTTCCVDTFSAAENLISLLQARDGSSIQSLSSPVHGPECCSYNSHGSSIQESPSEREPQTFRCSPE